MCSQTDSVCASIDRQLSIVIADDFGKALQKYDLVLVRIEQDITDYFISSEKIIGHSLLSETDEWILAIITNIATTDLKGSTDEQILDFRYQWKANGGFISSQILGPYFNDDSMLLESYFPAIINMQEIKYQEDTEGKIIIPSNQMTVFGINIKIVKMEYAYLQSILGKPSHEYFEQATAINQAFGTQLAMIHSFDNHYE